MKEYVDVEVLKQQDFQDFSNTDVMHAIDNCPRADVEPMRHGHWIKVFPRRMGRNATYKCSVCKKLRSSYYNDVAEWDHCPCGAKMDGKEE